MCQRNYAGRSAGQRRAERRERLLAAGLQRFGTQGYAATSIERLCTTAGVSTRNFYEEYGSKEALLIALHDRVLETAIEAVRTVFSGASERPLARRVELAVRAYVTSTASDPRWARLNYVEIVGVSPVVERHRCEWRDRWVDLLTQEGRRAAERGEAATPDFRLGAVALIGAINEIVHYWSTDGRKLPLDAVIDESVRIALAMVSAG